MDYELLKKKGLEVIQRLAGMTWTDHNSHDPGITMLEEIAYALTDLGYRLNFPMADLLASEESTPYASLYSPSVLLTSRPVTLLDLRKLVIDVPGVKNAWVQKNLKTEPAIYIDEEGNFTLQIQTGQTPLPLKGIYSVMVEPGPSKTGNFGESSGDDSSLKRMIVARLNANRNLCEDFEVTILSRERIKVKADIAVGHTEDPSLLMAKIWYSLAAELSPPLSFLTLREALAQGYTISEIKDGPQLDHGFLPDPPLKAAGRKTVIRTSDLISSMMRVEGIEVVQSMKIGVGDTLQDWSFDLSPSATPEFSPRESSINLYRGNVRVMPDMNLALALYEEMIQADLPAIPPASENEIIPPTGRERNIARYQSIQDQFPNTYGINELGLSSTASPQRLARARQLKGYLLFFEQILANYFSQAARMNKLLSWHHPEERTYFSQTLDRIREIEHLVNFGSLEEWQNELDRLNQVNEKDHSRRIRFLNHLIARFGEDPDEILPLTGETEISLSLQKIEARKAFLRDYPAISSNRGRAFDYSLPSWDSDNVSGYESRIARILGIRSSRRRQLVQQVDNVFQNEEGFHLVEHILLRPRPEDLPNSGPREYPGAVFSMTPFQNPETKEKYTRCVSPAHGLTEGEWLSMYVTPDARTVVRASNITRNTFDVQPTLSFGAKEFVKWEYHRPKAKNPFTFPFIINPEQDIDPFSLEMTLVFPGEAGRFADEGYRIMVRQTIERETPAHLTWNVLWLNNADMMEFETAWMDFLVRLQERSTNE